ncbi:MAG TPA: hypothetical protein VFA68_01355 [Terriglobales bacterium]|nr:hypothetical protein [Terriglobales bacterium]
MTLDGLFYRLCVANRELAPLLATLERGGQQSPFVLAESLERVLLSLAQVRDSDISELNGASLDARISSELSSYRNQLVHLRELLPGIQVRLLSERSRLEKERLHLETANAWAEGNRETFEHK